MVKSPKIEIFENFDKSAPSKIENLVEISVFLNEMVIRPTNKVQETHLWYWFFKPDRLVKVSEFFKWFQSDFFKNRLKLEFFWVLLLCCPVQYWKASASQLPRVHFFQDFLFFLIFFRPDFFRILFFGSFAILRHGILCPGDCPDPLGPPSRHAWPPPPPPLPSAPPTSLSPGRATPTPPRPS